MSENSQNPDTNTTLSEVQQSNPNTPERKVRQSDDDVVVISRVTINYVVIASLFFAVGLLVGGMSFSATINQDAIEAAVQNVLVEGGLIQPPANMDLLVDDDPFLGPEDAPIVIVEFSAYACPFCGRHFAETFEPILENYGQYIRYVYRDFPATNPEVSYPASFAANCALEQGYFWEYHSALFSNQNTLVQSGGSSIYLTQLAADIGLDTTSFSTCLSEQRYLDEVNADFNAGIVAGVSGTPSFYINGAAHSGARPYEYFEAIILRELEKAGINP